GFRVAVERRPVAREAARAAHDRRAAPRRIAPPRRRILEVELEIVGDEEVEAPVAIDVDEGGRRAPARAGEPGFRSHLPEMPLAGVKIQTIGADLGDEDVEVAAVVDIADRDAVPPARAADPRAFGGIGEMNVAIVEPERVARARLPRAERVERGAVREPQI